MVESAPPSLEPFAAVADVAVAGARLGNSGILSYAVPMALADAIGEGQLVWAPLRDKPALGLVTRIHDEARAFELKPLIKPVEPLYRVTPQQLDFAAWLA